ncbi:MAG: hypothetical protein MP439_10010 [Ferrimicrobium sp.]|jgi:hypothetical protein|nr:hypothetical protein [Ferrimicrobium sp.]
MGWLRAWWQRLGEANQRVAGADGRAREVIPMALYDQTQMLEGQVTSFDPHVGLGTVRLNVKPPHEVRFHCITIDDGSRAIGIGVRVSVRLKAGFGGELEVATLHKLS